jgi:hypothetical protein
MATSVFDKLRQAGADPAKSFTWYQTQVKNLSGLRADNLLKSQPLTNRILPGRMYLFTYDPKFKDTLPYFDRFPLVLPFRLVKEGFYGINLHYLPYLARFKLLGYLMELAIDETITDKTRINISWKLLSSSSKFAPVNACVKHYLTDHVQSRFLNIPFQDWITASQLPVENFVGANKNKVWRESRGKY